MLILLFTGMMFNTSAQELKLKEVRIQQRKKRNFKLQDERLNSFNKGAKILTIDTALLQQYELQSLAQLLTQQVPVFVKSYGINSMATLNFRGSSAAQSQVLWNGIPLNSAAAGITDVSMLSVSNFESINIAYGGSAALLGSGNISAAVLLDNQFFTDDTLPQWRTKLGAEYGSFGQLKLNVQERYSNKKMMLSLKLMHQQAENNFDYKNVNGNESKMQNAKLNANSLLINFGYKIAARTQFKFSAWLQNYDREVPPALFETASQKKQQDFSMRFLAQAHHLSKSNAKWYSKTAYTQDRMQYQDPSILLQTQNAVQQLYQEFGWKKQLKPQHEVLVFVPASIAWTLATNDTMVRYQKKIALAAAYQYSTFKERLTLAASLRAEQINTQSILLPGGNAAFIVHPYFKIRANIQGTYRAPTLNEWYYQPGGNPALKPERGLATDAGYELNLPINKRWQLKHDASFFNRNINDWIIWFGGSIWTPHNIAKVHSRGIETFNSLHWQRGHWHAHLGLNTSFVLATTAQSYLPNDGSIGKQIPYSPRYNGQANAGISYQQLSLQYNHTYTGYRFITIDESQYLKPYNTGNIYLNYTAQWQGLAYSLKLHYNNIWNSSYQVVAQRPMPFANWIVGLSCTF